MRVQVERDIPNLVNVLSRRGNTPSEIWGLLAGVADVANENQIKERLEQPRKKARSPQEIRDAQVRRRNHKRDVERLARLLGTKRKPRGQNPEKALRDLISHLESLARGLAAWNRATTPCALCGQTSPDPKCGRCAPDKADVPAGKRRRRP